MGGLVGYDSSDDDEEVQQPTQPPTATEIQQEPRVSTATNGPPKPSGSPASAATQPPAPSPAEPPQQPLPPPKPASSATPPTQPQRLGPVQGPTLGPVLGPSLGPSPAAPSSSTSNNLPQDQDPDQDQDQGQDATSPPKSPYTATRSLLHTLTLPPVPNTAIPPSPPGSPPPALTAKVASFLALKSGPRPTHFNARLAGSAAARNPGLTDKLLGFVGLNAAVDAEGRTGTDQYRTTLGAGDCGAAAWDPDAFPAWAYKAGLRRAADRAAKERERRVGERVEFVSGGGGGGGDEVKERDGTPVPLQPVPPVTGKRKTRFD